MASKRQVDKLESQQGEKMIELRVRFWTNDLADDGAIRPKHAWASGVVRVKPNPAHGIRAQRPVPFNSLLDLGAAIEETLIANGLTLHGSRRMSRYFSRSPEE
jgi:hypothetical protein